MTQGFVVRLDCPWQGTAARPQLNPTSSSVTGLVSRSPQTDDSTVQRSCTRQHGISNFCPELFVARVLERLAAGRDSVPVVCQRPSHILQGLQRRLQVGTQTSCYKRFRFAPPRLGPGSHCQRGPTSIRGTAWHLGHPQWLASKPSLNEYPRTTGRLQKPVGKRRVILPLRALRGRHCSEISDDDSQVVLPGG